MYYLFSIISLVLPALGLFFLDRVKPGHKFRWLLPFGGVLVSFILVLLWQLDFPSHLSLPAWQPVTLHHFQPAFLVDLVSWSLALSLVALAGAIILTAGMRGETGSRSWIFTLVYTALGILAVSAADPLTLVLVWTAMDFMALILGLFFFPGQEFGRENITSFSLRLLGSIILLVSCLVGSQQFMPLSFDGIPGLLLVTLLAMALRLGILPFGRQYPDEATSARGLFTGFRLVSATAGLVFLARVPGYTDYTTGNLVVLIFLVIFSAWVGWKWFSSSSEIQNRHFWILGIVSLAVVSSRVSEPAAVIGWGIMLILSGGLIFLFSSRDKKILWMPLLCLWGLAALPFSPTADVWLSHDGVSWILLICMLPAQSLLLSGFADQVLKSGDRLFEQSERWNRLLYIFGLALLCGVMILLGFWGWSGATRIGAWWASIVVLILSLVFFLLRSREKILFPPAFFSQQKIASTLVLGNGGKFLIAFIERVLLILSSTLEGEGGILWSILLLVLILSLVSLGGR